MQPGMEFDSGIRISYVSWYQIAVYDIALGIGHSSQGFRSRRP